MRVLLQRVSKASCTAENRITGKIGVGYLLFTGFTEGDGPKTVRKAARKIAGLRIFDDQNGKMNHNLEYVGGSVLSISQFTLYAFTEGGNRPSFTAALESKAAEKLYHLFNDELRKAGINTEEGIFGAHMKIELCNEGPVTLFMEFKERE